MSTQIDQLNTELKAAQAALDQALEDGVLSAPFRDEVARLEVALTAAQYTESTARAASAAEEAAKVQADARVLASTQQTVLQTTEVDAEMAAEPSIAALVDADPLLLSAAEGVVVARNALERAQRQHGDLSRAAGRIQAALTRKLEERDAIKARALAKTATAEDGLAILSIDEDLADLERSLSAARDKVTAANPTAEQGVLAAAEQHLARTRDELAYSFAEDRVRRAAEALLASHKEMVAAYNKKGAGITGGYSTSGRFKPSKDFLRFIDEVRRYWGTV